MSYTNTVSKCTYTTTVGVETVDERGEQEADAAESLEQPGYISGTVHTTVTEPLFCRHSHPQFSSPPLSTQQPMKARVKRA